MPFSIYAPLGGTSAANAVSRGAAGASAAAGLTLPRNAPTHPRANSANTRRLKLLPDTDTPPVQTKRPRAHQLSPADSGLTSILYRIADPRPPIIDHGKSIQLDTKWMQ